jgi:hypothetical protein
VRRETEICAWCGYASERGDTFMHPLDSNGNKVHDHCLKEMDGSEFIKLFGIEMTEEYK